MKKSRKGVGNHNSYLGSKNQNYLHGKTNTRQWLIWRNLKRRCSNPKDAAYKDYGGRGIVYGEKWESFVGFWEDMGSTYKDHLTIERIDVNGNYCKENCAWIPFKDQFLNKRKTIRIEFEGKSISLGELSKKFDINYHTLYNRIFVYGIPLEKAIKSKSFQHGRQKATVFLAGLLSD